MLGMIYEGLWEIVKGDFADSSAGVDGGPSGGSGVHRTRSEDPHRRKWILYNALDPVKHKKSLKCWVTTMYMYMYIY